MTRFSLVFSLAALGLAACAEAPSEALAADEPAFQTAQLSAEASYPPKFDLRAYFPGDAVDPDVTIRLGALEVIDHYNTVLVSLAEPQPDHEVRGAAAAFSHSRVDPSMSVNRNVTVPEGLGGA